MQIKIAEKLHPFSHTPGVKLLLPKSDLELRIFPTRLEIDKEVVPFALKGPIVGFTVEMDLEKGEVCVFSKEIRYFIRKVENGVEICFKKPSYDRMFIPIVSQTAALQTNEQLSLGMHKSQDWDLVKRRQDLKEIFPVWQRLSNFVPESKMGTFSLLDICRKKIDERAKLEIIPAFLNLFNASFEGILAPRLFDDQYQGFSDSEDVSADLSPITLAKEGGALIRSLFFKEEDHILHLLPCLPPEFHAGRFINIRCINGDLIDIEWSKKLIRQVIILPAVSSVKKLVLQKSIKSFRLRHGPKEEISQVTATLYLKAGVVLYLDRFEK
jgi:hypothetical protein